MNDFCFQAVRRACSASKSGSGKVEAKGGFSSSKVIQVLKARLSGKA
jgi:hypothetical protein